MTALFDKIIFGPIHSRRLGLSLGVNLLPQEAKICNFDCIYCECGSNGERRGEALQRRFAVRTQVEEALSSQLTQMAIDATPPDVITFAGNGEPTLHPEFEQIIESTIATRNQLCPEAKVSVLSNATTLDKESVVRALRLVDNPILKIDSAIQESAQIINSPAVGYSVERVIELMATSLKGVCIVQTMFLRGVVGGVAFDNTTETEIKAWLDALQKIKPRSVMIYSIDRDTPLHTLEKIDKEQLEQIAQRARQIGIECSAA
ncbi:MAG: radical SAM protein [Rikenellaceae bacterium]